MPKFRAIILLSTYNGCKFLPELLKSIDQQVNCSIKVIIRDDCSYVHPQEFISFSGNGAIEDIAFVNDELGNIGPAQSFLRLVALAPRGFDGYFYCDQDDIWLENKVETLCSLCREPNNPVLVCSNVTVVDEDLKGEGNLFSECAFHFPELIYSNVFPGCGMCFNLAGLKLLQRSIPERIYMHDWYTALLFSVAGTLVTESKSFTLYRQHRNNTVGVQRKRSLGIARLCRAYTSGSKFRRSFGMLEFVYRNYSCDMNSFDRRFLRLYFSSKRCFLGRLKLWREVCAREMSPRYKVRFLVSSIFNRH